MVKYIKYTVLLAAFVVVFFGLSAQKTEISKYLEQIDSIQMRTTLSTLASDELEGRGTGKQGGESAQNYIVAYLDSCGIKAGNNGSFFQDINYTKSFNVAKRRFIVDNVDYPDDYKYANLYHQDTVLNITEITFIAWRPDMTGVMEDDLADKIIMKFDDTPSDFIDDQNPKAVINIVSAFKPASSTVSERAFFTPPQSKYKHSKISVSTNLADKLLESTGKTLKDIADDIEKSGKPQRLTLKTSAEIHGNVIYRKTNVSNILGIIEGSDLKNEYIVLSAHHDHVGVINGETYNGADDNASGVSAVLEIARSIAKVKEEGAGPRRSVVILFPAAEEMGLIGSNYYTNNPVFPLTDTKACINVDMVGRIDNKYISTNGDYIYIVNNIDKKTDDNLLGLAEKSNSDGIVLNTEDLNSLFNRSDHYNFAKHNIPAVLLTSGLHKDYHTPRDKVELIDFSAMWKRCRFIFSLTWYLANFQVL
jgi:hypothetical protein